MSEKKNVYPYQVLEGNTKDGRSYYYIKFAEGYGLHKDGNPIDLKAYGDTPINNLESKLEKGFIEADEYNTKLERYSEGGDLSFVKIEFNAKNPFYQG